MYKLRNPCKSHIAKFHTLQWRFPRLVQNAVHSQSTRFLLSRSMLAFRFEAPTLPPEAHEARARVRAFLAEERDAGRYVPHRSSWMTFDAQFSRRAGTAGFIGSTWPKEYGGQAQSSLTRFVITEEML